GRHRSDSRRGRGVTMHRTQLLSGRTALAVIALLAGFALACGKSHEASTPAEGKSGERQILYYRHPMNPAVTSPVPAKDDMGMNYVPVYADEAQASAG